MYFYCAVPTVPQPAGSPRHPLPRDNVFTQLVALVYNQDTNTNVLPQHSCGRLHVRLLCRLELPPLAQALDPGVYLDRICPCGRLHRVCQAAFRAGSDFGRSLRSGRLSCGLPADFSQNVGRFSSENLESPAEPMFCRGFSGLITLSGVPNGGLGSCQAGNGHAERGCRKRNAGPDYGRTPPRSGLRRARRKCPA